MEPDIFNTQLEVEFLRTLIVEGDLIYEVLPEVTAEMLSSMPHQYIYRGLKSLAERNVGISRETLLGELNDKGWLDEAGSLRYMDETILKGHPNKRAIKEHIKKIQNSYKTRILYELNAKIPDWIENPNNIDIAISRINKNLDNLVASTGNLKNTVSIGEAIDQVFEDIKARKENPKLPGVSTGFTNIDNLTAGLMEGDLWYVAARPSMGKSAWLVKALINMAKSGIPCLLFSQEMSQRQLFERIFAIESEVGLLDIRLGKISDDDVARLEKRKDELKELPLYIDSTFGASIEEIGAMIRKYNQLHGIKVVGIDYIQIVVERGGDATAELGKASRLLKLISNELGISTIVISQLNREVEKREDKRPLMADLRQSGNLEEDADILACLYRDEVYHPTSPDAGTVEFIIRKARNSPIGTIPLNFDKNTVNIYDATLYDWQR